MSASRAPRGRLYRTMRALYIAGVAAFVAGTVVWVLADAGLDSGGALYAVSVVVLTTGWLALVLAASASTYRRWLVDTGHPAADPARAGLADH